MIENIVAKHTEAMITIGRSPRTRIRKETKKGRETNIRMMKNQKMKKAKDERRENAKMNEKARTDIRVRKDQIKETNIANVAMMIIGEEKNAMFRMNEVEQREQKSIKYFHKILFKFNPNYLLIFISYLYT